MPAGFGVRAWPMALRGRRTAGMAVYETGSIIARREVLHGLVWMQHEVQVVSDDGSVLAVLVRPGTPMVFPGHPFGPHPWAGRPAWAGPTVLQLYRPGDLYSVWMMFRDGQAAGSYINFEAALSRHARAFDTVDYGLDIVIDPSGAWRFKDVDDPARYVATGRMSEAEASAVLLSSRSVAADLERGRRWWAPWDSWRPPTATA